MKDFFVNQIFDGFVLIAFPIAFVAGVISFLSPCVLPLVPGYLSYTAGSARTRGQLLRGSLLFVLGFTSLFLSYGALFGGLGSTIAANSSWLTRIFGAFTVVMGLLFLGKFPMVPSFKPRMKTFSGIWGAAPLGFLFGIGWTPCIGATLAAVETLSFQSSSAIRGAILSLGYCLGLGLPFILTGLFLDRSQRMRKFLTRNGDRVTQIGGIFLIVIGLLQLFGAWSHILNQMRDFISNFVPVI
jgi:cytochrome c-type biogenesis protein